ncbi:hypothetical protein [Micromonospora sp. NPDC003241]
MDRHGWAASGSGARRQAPVVTVHDAASHAMCWIGSALGGGRTR